MTFGPIKSGGWAVGDELKSTEMNSVNNDIQNAIDKTGETAASGGGVSGEVDFLNGSVLQLQTGSQLQIQGGSSAASLASGSTLTVGDGATLSCTSASTISLGGDLRYSVTAVPAAGSLYSCSSFDFCVLIDTSTTAKTIQLPAPAAGKVITIKDSDHNASVNNILLVPFSTEKIDKIYTSATFTSNSATLTLISDGTNWWITTLYGTISLS